jgi:hypothetical protein
VPFLTCDCPRRRGSITLGVGRSALGILGCANWRVQSRELFLLISWQATQRRRSATGDDGAELSKHAEVVADRPPFSDLALDEPIHGGEVAIVVSRRCVDAQK